MATLLRPVSGKRKALIFPKAVQCYSGRLLLPRSNPDFLCQESFLLSIQPLPGRRAFLLWCASVVPTTRLVHEPFRWSIVVKVARTHANRFPQQHIEEEAILTGPIFARTLPSFRRTTTGPTNPTKILMVVPRPPQHGVPYMRSTSMYLRNIKTQCFPGAYRTCSLREAPAAEKMPAPYFLRRVSHTSSSSSSVNATKFRNSSLHGLKVGLE